MPSHRALSLPDIIHLIFDELSDDKPTLARSARTCRAFYDISLNILWRNLESVAPLQKLVPRHEAREDGTFVCALYSAVPFQTDNFSLFRRSSLDVNGRDSIHMRNA